MFDRRKSTSFAPLPSFASDASDVVEICLLLVLVFEKALNSWIFFEDGFVAFLVRFGEL